MPAPTLSVCVTTFNMAPFLPALLDNVAPVADEIVVLDSFSTDGSVELLRARPGVRLLQHAFDDHFGRHKNRVIEAARGDWVLLLDSDELLGDTLRSRLPGLLRTRRYSHYKLPRYWLVPGLPLRYVDSDLHHPDHQLRLFRNTPFFRYPEEARVHEHFPRSGRGRCRRLRRGRLFHLDFLLKDRATREAKARHYDALGSGTRTTSRMYLYEDIPHRLRRCRERLSGVDSAIWTPAPSGSSAPSGAAGGRCDGGPTGPR